MAKVLLRQKAVEDLNDIWNYTAKKWSEVQADKYYAAIQLAFTRIAQNQSLGKPYDDIKEHLLGYKSGKHIIFYRLISPDNMEVIRILHERMDLQSRLSGI